MWQRFTLNDVRTIGHYLGVLILLMAAAMAVPFLVALAFREWKPAASYLLSIGISLILGSALRLLRVTPARLTRRQALAVTGFAWIVLAFIAAIPLFFSGHFNRFLDALFECVSGFTTTGASLVVDLDHLSMADNAWRFILILLGGLGLVVVALALGLFGKRSGASLYSSEGRSDHLVPNVVQTTQFIAKFALAFILIATVILTVVLVFAGIQPVRAVFHSACLSVSAFMTGGFTPMSQSVIYYHSFPLEVILMVLMLAGAISFTLHAELRKGRIAAFFRDIEIRTMLVWIAVATCVMAASLSMSLSFNDLPSMLRRGVFMVVSSFSTTGFQNITTNQLAGVFSSGAFIMLAVLMAVGGSAGSTSGGVKLLRMGVMAKSIISTIRETVAPDSARVAVTYYRLGRRRVTPDIVKEAMTVFVLYVATYAVGALVGIAHGYDATQAIFESVAMASNGGVVSGLVAPDMPLSLELFYIFEMWAGRLEFVTLLAILVEVVASAIPNRVRHAVRAAGAKR
ncbi:MAG: potassium transporter TrkG [Eggerthellaceae bacterium]|nr:potassium transporter TrkG [Eggerthellaceae bacterium]